MPAETQPTIGVVVLTMGNRPVELQRALESLLAQRSVAIDAVVVGNGWDPTEIPEGIRLISFQKIWVFRPAATLE